MADSFSSSIPIPMFNGDNYDIWSIKMKTYFCAHNLWDVISNGYTVPDDFSTLTVAKKKKLLEKNRQRDSSALLALQSCLTDKYFSRIKAAETSKEAWDILKKDFHDNEKKCFIVGPDPLAVASKKEHSTSVMEFNVGANFPIKGKPKSKNKIRNYKERQNAAADLKNNTPPGRDRKRGRAHDSDPKDDSSSSKKRAHDSDSEDDSSSPKERKGVNRGLEFSSE